MEGETEGNTGGKGELTHMHTRSSSSIKELLINQEAIHFGVWKTLANMPIPIGVSQLTIP